MHKENNKNKDNLISCLKSIKKQEEKSQVIFMLGAGFSKHVYDMPLWGELVDDYTKKEYKNKLTELNNFEIQLILDYAQKKDNYYTKKMSKNADYYKSNKLGFKNFYDQLRIGANISIKFITTNHCESIQKYFDINSSFIFDIKNIKEDEDKFKENYYDPNTEIIINLHGSIKNKNQIVISEEYHNFFYEEYRYIFEIMKPINDENEKKIIKNIVLIFGSSFEEKHLISFVRKIFGMERIFYINHKKIRPKFYPKLKSSGFNYISTCQSPKTKRCNAIDECNNLFFSNMEKQMKNFISPKNKTLFEIHNEYNEQIIKDITSIKNYVFGKTFKEIDKIIKEKTENEVVLYQILHKNHFLTIFLSEAEHKNIGKYIVNLFLYYYEKHDMDFWNILNTYCYSRNRGGYFNVFLQHIIISKKFNFDFLSNNYMYISTNEKKLFELFSDFFSNVKKLEKPLRKKIIFNFYEENINSDSFYYYKNIWFIKKLNKLNKFNIEIDTNEFINKFIKGNKMEDTYSYLNFNRKKMFIFFITTFLKIDKITNIFEDLIPELKTLKKTKEISFSGNNLFSDDENTEIIIEDFDFIRYIFMPYMEENKDTIILPPFKGEEFLLITEFNKKTNFLINYYSAFDNHSKEINKIFSDIKYRNKIWKIPENTYGIAVSYDANFVDSSDLEHFKEKWNNLTFEEIFNSINEKYKEQGGILYENAKIQFLKDKIDSVLLEKKWKNQIGDITNQCLKLGNKVLTKPWNNWKFILNAFTNKYVQENEKISILDLDRFFVNSFPKEYLDTHLYITKFDNVINLEIIQWKTFSDIEKVESNYLFKQLFDLLNINSGNIFWLFRDTFNGEKEDDSGEERMYTFKIWKRIFNNSKNIPKLINKIIKVININSDEEESYKIGIRKMLEKVFLDSDEYNIGTWKKALYYYFDSFPPENKKFYEDSYWMFKDTEFKELTNYLETISYETKNSNIKTLDISLIIEIKYYYKKLFFQKNYDNTELLYKLVFTDKKTLIEFGRPDFTLFEIKVIYGKFYENDLNLFKKIIKVNDLEYIWNIFMNLGHYELTMNDIDMLKNIHNLLKNEEVSISNVEKIEKIKEIIHSFTYSNEWDKIEKNNSKVLSVIEELYKFKFCLLSLSKEEISKEITKLVKENYDYFTNTKQDNFRKINEYLEKLICNDKH